MLYLVKDLKFLARHADQRGINWFCKKTQAQIRFHPVDHRVEGEVPGRTKYKKVPHIFCPECSVQPDFPAPDTLIREADLAPMGW